jgi:hypothetical protein
VWDLGCRPHRDLLAGRVDDGGARLHEGGYEALLAVVALDDDAVVRGPWRSPPRRRPLCRPRPSRASRRRTCWCPCRGGRGLVLHRLQGVEDGGQLVILDIDELGRVASGGGRARDDHGDDLAGTGDPLTGEGEVVGSDLIGGDRPGVGARALPSGKSAAVIDRDDIGGGLRGSSVSIEVIVACANGLRTIARWTMPGQGDVVGPLRAAGDEALVLLAQAAVADLGRALVDGGHLTHHPSAAGHLLAHAATALTML